MKKCIASALMLCLLLTGCYASSPSSKQKSIFTDDSLISSQSDSYCNGPDISVSGNSYSSKAKDFTGSKTIWHSSLSTKDTVSLDYTLNHKNGDFKIVLVYPDESVKTIWSSQLASPENKTFFLTATEPGRYTIKVAGIHAKTNFNFQIVENPPN